MCSTYWVGRALAQERYASKNGPHRVGYAPPEDRLLWLTEASTESQLAAGNGGVDAVKVRAADCPPGTLAEDLQGTRGKTIDVDPAHKPRCSLLPCTRHKISPDCPRPHVQHCLQDGGHLQLLEEEML